MNILYVVSGTGLTGGATKSFLRMMEGAIKAGHSCYVVCPNKGELYQYLKANMIPVYVIHYVFNASYITSSFFSRFVNWIKWQRRRVINIQATQKLISICKDINPDIIHTNSSIINIGALASNRLGIPHIMHFREYGDLDFNYDIQGLDKYLKKDNCYSIAITHSIYNYRKLPSKKAIVIYNGICYEREVRFSSKKAPYILFAGRVQETKGILDLIEAYILYANKMPNPLKLKIAGNYNFEEGEKLKKEIGYKLEKNGLLNNVDWMGECSGIEDLMYKATMTVVPSKNEGFGRVMPEAIANGCLVIGRNTAGTKEQINNGQKYTGRRIALPFDSVQELAESIYEVHSRGIESYFSLIEAGQKVIKEIYTVEGYQRNILNYYSKIVNRNENNI